MREAAVGNALSPTVDSRVGGDQCRRWRRSQSLPWTDVGYTSKFVTEISL